MREGNIFSLFTLAGWGGGQGGKYPIPGQDKGVSLPGPDGEGVPHPADRVGYAIPGMDGEVSHPRSGGGYPIPGLDGGVPNPRSRQGEYPIPGLDGGVYPILLMGGTPIQDQDWGIPWGTPHQELMGPSLPHLGLDEVPPPPPRTGSRTGWGSSPHPRSGWGTSHPIKT